MKFFGVIVLLAVAGSSQAMPDVRSKRSAIDDNLVSVVEKIQEIMKTGNEDLGIPILDPAFISSFEFAIAHSMVTFTALLTNAKVHSLSDFTIDLLTYSEDDMTFSFAFPWSVIDISTEYAIDGMAFESVPFFGKGDLNVLVKNLRVSGTVTLSKSIDEGNLQVAGMTTAITLEQFKAEGTGFMDDDDASALISAIVSDMMPYLLVEYQETVTTTVNAFIVDFVNRYLSTVTLEEFLAFIRG